MESEQRYLDHVAISRVQTAYADIVNRRAWGELGNVFADDVDIEIDTVDREPIRLQGPAAFRNFVEPAVDRFEFFEFVILNTHIDLPTARAPGEASARIHMCEIRRDAADRTWSTAFGLYQDRYRRADAGWRIAERRYRSLARTDGDPLPPPVILGGPAIP